MVQGENTVVEAPQVEFHDNTNIVTNEGDLVDDNDPTNGGIDMDDMPPHQTFDNLNVNVEFLTDDDDEELQEARMNVRAFRMKNTFGRKENNSVEDDHTHALVEIDDIDDDNLSEVEAEDDEVYGGGSGSDKDSTGSFYYDSDDHCSYYSETDEECGDHALRRPSKIIRYDPKSQVPVFCCGMVFLNVDECRDALAKYAIVKSLQIHYIKNDKVRIRAACMSSCPWSFFASKDGANANFTVKTYNPHHKCHRKNTNPMATSKYLAKHLRERLMSTPFIKVKDLKALCRTELKLRVGVTQARNIKNE